MVRYEVKTIHKSFVGCEGTLKEAKAYISSLENVGVEIVDVKYFSNDIRINDIRNGNFNTKELI